MEKAGERNIRTVSLIGEDAFGKLQNASVAVIGIGGVGSYAAEAIARSGIGRIALMDGDNVAESNLNRQLVALNSTLGMNKADVMAERIRDINPEADVEVFPFFYKNADSLKLDCYDYVIDAIDDVDAKVELIRYCINKGINIVSAMGAAGKFGTAFVTADISKTSTCPLARTMRKRLRDIGIEHLPVVYSEEKPAQRNGEHGTLGTLSYVPGAAGLELAGYVIKEVINK